MRALPHATLILYRRAFASCEPHGRYSPECSLRVSKSSAMWYFLYFSANCNARKIDIKNMSIKRDAVARCAGPQKNHCSTAGAVFVFDGSNADVLFFSYSLSERYITGITRACRNNENLSSFLSCVYVSINITYETCLRDLENHPRRSPPRQSIRR